MAINKLKQPKVSVIMPCYNHQKYIDTAIRSVLNQSYNNFELIIVDDKSSDGSIDKIEHYRKIDDRIISLYHKNNMGASSCRNDAIKKADGDFIAFCDADDVWLNDKLEIQIELMTNRCNKDLLYCDSLIIDSSGSITGNNFSDYYQPFTGSKSAVFHKLCITNFINLSTVLLKKECADRIGYFDIDVRYVEDWLFWVSLAKYYDFYYLSRPLVKYRVHENSSNLKYRDLLLNRIKVYLAIIERFPELPISIKSDIFYHIGRSYISLDNNTSAQESFRQAVRFRKYNLKYLGYYIRYYFRGMIDR
jgi:teichuronic acid biosynthesis glycosyltransferase TuaG